jgi:hypothetical protein
MPTPTSLFAYDDCYEIMNQALEDEEGARVELKSHDEANNFRMRLNAARTVMRENNREVYPPGDQMHGRSVFDGLVFRIKRVEGKFYVYLMRHAYGQVTVEKLSQLAEPENEPEPEAPTISRRI